MSNCNFGYSEKEEPGRLGDFTLWRRILEYIRPHRMLVGLAVLLSLAITGVSLSLPYLIRLGVDNYLLSTGLSPAVRQAGLFRLGSLFTLLIVTGFGANFLQVLLLEKTGQQMMHRMRQDLFQHLLTMDVHFFNERHTGRLVTRLTNDIQNMHEMYTSVVVTLFNDLLKILGILVLLFWMHPRLALAMLLFLPLMVWGTIWFSRVARSAFRAIRTSLAAINGFVQESLAGLTVLQTLGREQATYEKFQAFNTRYLGNTLHQIKMFSLFMPLMEGLGTVAVAVIIWLGGSEVMDGTMTLGVLIAYLSYMRLFFQPLRELAQKYSIVQSALASAERIFSLLDKRPLITSPLSPIRLQQVRGAVAFDRVTFGYDRDRPVVRDISFAIAPGETLAVVGATGSGKTTLINLLERFYDPDQGTVTLDGHPLPEFDPRWLRRVIALVSQEVFMVPATLRENILLDHQAMTDDQVWSVLEKVQLAALIKKLPEQMETVIGDGGMELSSGQKQLVALARVLVYDPRIVVLDEATSSIDSATEMLLEKAMAATLAGRTSIIIAHRLSTVRRADRILVMAGGRIAEIGSHEELLVAKGVYHALLDTL